jgi:hypothetical protein
MSLNGDLIHILGQVYSVDLALELRKLEELVLERQSVRHTDCCWKSIILYSYVCDLIIV